MTVTEAIKLIRNEHYHKINPHQKHFINQVIDKETLSLKQERFVFFIAKRFNIFIQKTFFPVKNIKPNLPTVIIRKVVEPETPFISPVVQSTEQDAFIRTGLGQYFDSTATVEAYRHYRPRAPYDTQFHSQNILTIYGMLSRSKVQIGPAFLEMIAKHSRHKEERLKIQSFLVAMEYLDSLEEPPAPKIPMERGFAKKGRDLVKRWK